MLRMVGFGDNAGSGFPAIFETWKNNGWKTPELVENTVLNQVTLSLSFVKATTKSSDKKSAIKIGEKKVSVKVESHVEEIVGFLTNKGEATTAEIAEAIGLKPSRTRELLDNMK